MRLRTATELSDLSDVLIHRIERGGYAVSVYRMGDYVEMHAVRFGEPHARHVARVADGDEEEHLYQCVREVARMAGLEPDSR